MCTRHPALAFSIVPIHSHVERTYPYDFFLLTLTIRYGRGWRTSLLIIFTVMEQITALAAKYATPADRVQVLREAFAKTVNDPEFVAEARKAKITVGYIGPDAVLKLFNGLLEQPAEVQKEMVKYIKFGD